ncbi:MAG: helix-turn-helix domain-containing protein [Rhodococcus sp. (in: high G+C Gram-positive bacteria)]
MTKRLLDIDDAADYLNVNPRFIRRLIAQRRVNYLKIGKFVRFDQDELDEWVQQRRVDAQWPA